MSNLTLCFCINHYLDNLEFFRIQRIRDYASGQITRMYSTKFYLKIFIYQRRFRTRDGQENSFSVFFFFLFFSRFPDHFSLSFFPPFSFSLFSRKRKFFFFPGGKRKLFFFFLWEKKKISFRKESFFSFFKTGKVKKLNILLYQFLFCAFQLLLRRKGCTTPLRKQYLQTPALQT